MQPNALWFQAPLNSSSGTPSGPRSTQKCLGGLSYLLERRRISLRPWPSSRAVCQATWLWPGVSRSVVQCAFLTRPPRQDLLRGQAGRAVWFHAGDVRRQLWLPARCMAALWAGHTLLCPASPARALDRMVTLCPGLGNASPSLMLSDTPCLRAPAFVLMYRQPLQEAEVSRTIV